MRGVTKCSRTSFDSSRRRFLSRALRADFLRRPADERSFLLECVLSSHSELESVDSLPFTEPEFSVKLFRFRITGRFD